MLSYMKLRPITTYGYQVLFHTRAWRPLHMVEFGFHSESSSINRIRSTSTRNLSDYEYVQQDKLKEGVPKYQNNEYQLNESVRKSQGEYQSIPEMKLRILFLTNAHNFMSQAAYLMLKGMGHTVMIELALSSEQMEQVATELKPDFIICPFLTKVVPESLYTKFKTLIVHPGIVGDRGMHSIDWALLEQKAEWGVTVVEAAKEMDAGPIYGTQNFPLDTLLPAELTKSKIYRNHAVPAALKAIHQAITNIVEQVQPIPLDYSNPAVKGTLKPTMKHSDCAINWECDDAKTVVRKISARDSNPGLLDDKLFGERMYLYGAHIENLIKTPPGTQGKQLLGQRDGAILVSCNGGKELVWITHMKRATNSTFKLPSTMLLDRDRLATLPYLTIGFTTVPTNATFNEVYYTQKGNIIFLHFSFYNGAMSTTQCQHLLRALDEVSEIGNAKIIVLCGGSTYFSNGVHLNVIEGAEDKYDESWANINAIDDVVFKIMSIRNKLIISALQGSAGAGGIMMALAADYVYANSQIILNPHYRGMGLFGSEYWTYNLPRRVGYKKAYEITEVCLPVTAKQAHEIGLIDGILSEKASGLLDKIQDISNALLSSDQFSDLIQKKTQESDSLFYEKLAECRSDELAKMSENFRDPAYNAARHAFVHKITPLVTPWHMKCLGRDKAIRVDGIEFSQRCQTNISLEIKALQAHAMEAGIKSRPPGLACLLVGNRRDAALYVQKKVIQAVSMGFSSHVTEIKDHEWKTFNKLQDRIIQQINHWNNDPEIDGILVQLPLPKALDHRRILDTIRLDKDVDGLHSYQLAALTSASNSKFSRLSYICCTVRGILEILQFYDVKLPGKLVCIVGASITIGVPLSMALSTRGSTITMCTLQTTDLKAKVEAADIVVGCAGAANLVKANWIKSGAIVIDAGITVTGNVHKGKMKVQGDVEQTDLLWKRASLITPVPGGVGPITVAMLLQNTFDAYKFHLTQEISKAKK
ncbi:unnamed protein product [Rotaria socialis]